MRPSQDRNCHDHTEFPHGSALRSRSGIANLAGINSSTTSLPRVKGSGHIIGSDAFRPIAAKYWSGDGDDREDAEAGDEEGRPRDSGSVAITPPTSESDARHRRADRLEHAHHPRLHLRRGQLLDGADHRDPLDAVAGAADDRGGAGQRPGSAPPPGRGSRRRPRRAEEAGGSGSGACRSAAKIEAAEHHPDPPAGEQQAVAGVAGAERFLGVDHLDRDHRGEEDEGGALGDQQAAQRRPSRGCRRPRRGPGRASGPASGSAWGSGRRSAGSRRSGRRRPRRAAAPSARRSRRRRVPARPGPTAAPPVKATLSSALPARSSPAGSSIAATTARVSVRPVSARAPSIVGDHDHAGQREVAGEQGQGAEGRGLAAVDHRQHEARRRPLAARDQERRQQRRQESRSEEEPGGRQGAVGAVEDEHREGDDPHPVAHLVDRVGGRQTAKGGPPQGVGQALLRIARRTVHCIYAQVFLQMHKFRRTCATNFPALMSFGCASASDGLQPKEGE